MGKGRNSRIPREDPEDGQQKTYRSAFMAGMWLGRSDPHRGANEGLGEREVRALSDENSRPWGQDIFIRGAIKDRCREAGHIDPDDPVS